MPVCVHSASKDLFCPPELSSPFFVPSEPDFRSADIQRFVFHSLSSQGPSRQGNLVGFWVSQPQADVGARNYAAGGVDSDIDHVKRPWRIEDIGNMGRSSDLRLGKEVAAAERVDG